MNRCSFYVEQEAAKNNFVQIFDRNLDLDYQKKSKIDFNNGKYEIKIDSVTNQFRARVNWKNMDKLCQTKPEIIFYERERAKVVIDDCLRMLYFNLNSIIDLDCFAFVVENSCSLKELFGQNFDLFQDSSSFVIKNFISNININELLSSLNL